MDDLVDDVAEKNSNVADIKALERVFEEMDPLVVRRYLIERRAHIDYVLNMQEAREEGLKKWIEEGVLQSARKLRSQGVLSDEKIAEALDIPIETVKVL